MVSNQKAKYWVFILIVFVIVGIFFFLLANVELIVQNIVWIALLLVFLFLIWKFDFIIVMKDYERAVVYRFGKVNRVGGPGWTIILPPIETVDRVDLRVQTIDVPKRDVITKDQIELKVDSIIYIRVKKDPQSVINSVVEVEDYKEAIRLYIVSLIRDIIGNMTLAEVIANIDLLNEKLKAGIEKISRGWGISVEAVELRDVDIPRTVIEAMHAQKAAVQERLARIEKALAHKVEIDAVKEAAEGLSEKALSYYYIKALEEMARGKSSKIIFPMELSRIADTIAGKLGRAMTPDEKQRFEDAIEPYKKLFFDYVNKAVKEAKEKEKKPKPKSKPKSST